MSFLFLEQKSKILKTEFGFGVETNFWLFSCVFVCLWSQMAKCWWLLLLFYHLLNVYHLNENEKPNQNEKKRCNNKQQQCKVVRSLIEINFHFIHIVWSCRTFTCDFLIYIRHICCCSMPTAVNIIRLIRKKFNSNHFLHFKKSKSFRIIPCFYIHYTVIVIYCVFF